MLGMDIEDVRREVQRAASSQPAPHRPARRSRDRRAGAASAARSARPTAHHGARDRQAAHPGPRSCSSRRLGRADHRATSPTRRTRPCSPVVGQGQDRGRHGATGSTRSPPPPTNDQVRSLVAALAVEPLALTGAADSRYVVANSAKLQLLTAMRAVGQLKSKLQRTNPVEHPTKYNQMFSELVVLEARAEAAAGAQPRRRGLVVRLLGATSGRARGITLDGPLSTDFSEPVPHVQVCSSG